VQDAWVSRLVHRTLLLRLRSPMRSRCHGGSSAHDSDASRARVRAVLHVAAGDSARVVATLGQFERRLIGQRTRDALAAKRAAGVRLGRPPGVPGAVVLFRR